MKNEHIHHLNKKEIVYQYLYHQITTNSLKPGQVISESEISNITGVSRTPLREALKRLESEGLVIHKRNHSTCVNPITIQDVEEVYTLRITLEGLALKESINRICDTDINALLARLKEIDETHPVKDFINVDRELHELIISNSGNQRLQKILANLSAQVERLRNIGSLKKNRMMNSRNEHIEILKAVKTRNPERAQCLLTAHLYNVKENAIEQCKLLLSQ